MPLAPSPTQTDSAAFQAWFGSSKVTDPAGLPLKVFHGTDEDFVIFDFARGDTEQGGPCFTDCFEIAQDYGAVMSVYLRIERPFELTYREWLEGEGPSVAELKARGHDGFIITDFSSNGRDGDAGDEMDDVGTVYVPFSPTQIKAANGNIGRFDPSSANIMA